jgi:starch phosphorylase
MPNIQTYNVIPNLPAKLEPLREMVFNLWWTWEPLRPSSPFRHLDPELWDRTNHNPVRMLQLSRQARLVEVAQDEVFLREPRRGPQRLQEIPFTQRYLRKERRWGRDQENRSPIFRLSLAFMSRSRITPAVWGFYPAIIANRRVTST